MADLTPPDATPSPSTPDDLRIGDLLGRALRNETPAVALIGFESDEGVRINGGRPGASEAPDAVRRAFLRLTPDAEAFSAFTELLQRTADLGNVRIGPSLEENQERLGRVVAECLQKDCLPVVLGGGHETAFGHFLGYAIAGREVEILNWDAHLDVRPLKDGRAHSGSPFRQALEREPPLVTKYTAAGLQRHSVSREHATFVTGRGGTCVWRNDVTPDAVDSLYASLGSPAMVTFDMDAVDQAWAPGVSAPAVDGLTPALWFRAARLAGRSAPVASIDICECNPRVDPAGSTVRLSAVTLWHFFRGLAERV